MYVSEDTFPHLREAADARRLRELEHRRMDYERRAARTRTATRRSGLRERMQSFRRLTHLAPKPIPHP